MLHYDTTTQKLLNNEWVTIFLKTSIVKTFYLKLLNITVGDRKNIVRALVASLGLLAIAGSTNKSKLWEKVTAPIIDSVNKNLEVGVFVSASLASTHVPLHLFVLHLIAKYLIVATCLFLPM